MDFTQILPTEIVEEIWLYLSGRDLTNCSQVSKRWYEFINNNRIWGLKCLADNVKSKVYLKIATSGIKNPAMKFRPRERRNKKSDTLPPLCHWRVHYDRYKFAENNCRRGSHAIHWLTLTPMHYSDGIIIGKPKCESPNHYFLYDISKFKSVSLRNKIPPMIDNVIFKSGSLIYSYRHGLGNTARLVVTCKKWIQVIEEFQEMYSIEIDRDPIIMRYNPKLRILCSDQHLIVHYSRNPFFLQIFDLNSGTYEKAFDLESFVGTHCTEIRCEEAAGDKVYVRFKNNNQWYIIQVDCVTEEVPARIEVSGVTSIVASKKFFSAKIVQNQADVTSELKLWSSYTMEEVAVLITDRTCVPIFTVNDNIIFHEGQTIVIRSLLHDYHRNINVPSNVKKLCLVRDKILVCNLQCSVQVWDIASGQKLYVLYRHSFHGMWADERAIVIQDVTTIFNSVSYAHALW